MYLLRVELLAAAAGLLPRAAFAFSDLQHLGLHAAQHEKRLLGLLGTSGGPLDLTGDHEWQAPAEDAQRGPCPGLNALANHGFIPRDGVVSFLGVINAMTDVIGVSIELATILAVMGTVWTGNPISLNPSFSIGGETPEVQNLLGNALGLLGEPRGLDHSHNFIEADSSPTRDDLYVTGDPVTMNLTTFERLYDMVPEGSDQTFTLDVLTDHAANRWNDSVSTNPYFYYGPVTGLIARNTGFCFILRLLGNNTENGPVMTHDMLKSWFGVTGDRDNFVYNKGHERIPDGWYGGSSQPYSLVQLNLDIVHMILRYPIFGSVGGNTGAVNSFTGVNLADPVDGLANLPRLLEGNNLICFVLEFINTAAPNYMNNLFTTVLGPLKMLTDAIAAPLLDLSCPQLGEITEGGVPLWQYLGQEYPGANNSGSAM